MRACQPSRDGYVERDGVKLYYEVYGAGEPTILLLPTWSIMHSRHWKMQIPYLARHCRVLTFDGRGNGRSDRPTEPEAYRSAEFTADALAVMDAITAQIGRPVDYRPVETDGAARAANLIAQLI
jgi:pimeloyl-ACP methyl ester carboxylesterase